MMRSGLGIGRAAILAVATLVSACKDEKKTAAVDPTLADRVRDAVEQNLRAGGMAQMRFRGETVFTQAMPKMMAVCGQVTPFSDAPNIFVPFVTLVTLADDKSQYRFDNRIGRNPSDASRVYVSLVDYCFENGGPSPGPYGGIKAMPPLPDAIPDPTPKPKLTLVPAAPAGSAAAPPAPANPPAPVPASTPAPVAGVPPGVDTVTMRQSANVHSDPHGPTVRVAQQGTTLHVFSQATGGWYQVGDTAPWGWVHESMLDKK